MIIKCEHCSKKILLSRATDGQKVKCPHCAEHFIIKEDETPAQPVDSPAVASEDLKIVVDEPTSTRTLERITILHLTGDIDTPAVPILQKAFEDQMAKKNMDIILDMAGVRYINSVGMGLLARMKNDLMKKFGSLSLCGVRDNVKRLMQVIGLLKLFDIYANVDIAKKAFAGQLMDVEAEDAEAESNRKALIKCLICGKTSEISQHDRCKSYLSITRNYVWEHKNASISDVSQATGIPESFVRTIVANNWFATTGGFYSQATEDNS